MIDGKYWDKTTQAERDVICNGIGPSYFPQELRHAIDSIFKVFRESSTRHDVWYEYGKSWAEKKQGDDEFLTNMLSAAFKKYFLTFRFFKYCRFRGYAYILYRFVRDKGDDAFWHQAKIDRLGLFVIPNKPF